MISRRNEIIVGASVLIAIVLAIYGYVFLRQIPVRRNGYTINIIFNNVSGLQINDKVLVSGLKVGRVRKMRLERGNVKVGAWLDGQVDFPADSRAVLRSIGMIGEKYIELVPGTSEENLREDSTIQGSYMDDLADIGGGVSQLVSQATALLEKLNINLDAVLLRKAQEDMVASIDHIKNMSEQMDQSFNANLYHVERTLANLDKISTEWNNFWTKHSQNIDSTLFHVSASTTHLPKIVANMDSVIIATKSLLTLLEQQQGTMGKIIYDPDLYNKANVALDEMQTILAEVKKDPSKYMRFSVIDLF